MIRPLLGTFVRPNHLTTLRLLTGLLASVMLAQGTPAWARWAGTLWIISALLDRADGELARVGHMMSAEGHRYDYLTDNIVNSLFFLAIGISLRDSWLNPWAIPLGVISGGSMLLCSLFAEWLELRCAPGKKAYAGRWGFDPDDPLYLLGPLAWLGWLAPVLILASVVIPLMTLITGYRLLILKRSGARGVRLPTPEAVTRTE